MEGRALVTRTLVEWGIQDDGQPSSAFGDLLLVTTELLANAARVCAGPVTLSMAATPTGIRVTVIDDSPRAPTLPASAAQATGGRGLRIVEALASSWGQTPYRDGTKSVWAEVAIPWGAALHDGAEGSGKDD
jgi:hypothetical protein